MASKVAAKSPWKKGEIMGPILLAIILFVVDWLVALPYPIHVILMVAAAVALIYGLYVLFVGAGRIGVGHPRYGRRYWY